MALVRVHAFALHDTQAEELVVEQLQTLDEGAMLAIVPIAKIAPSYFVGHCRQILRRDVYVVDVVVPPHVGDVLCGIGAHVEQRPVAIHVGAIAREPACVAPHCHLRTLVVHLIRHPLHGSRGHRFQLLLVLRGLLQCPDGLKQPRVQLDCDRYSVEVSLLSPGLRIALVLEIKAALDVACAVGNKGVRKHVYSQHDPSAWLYLHLVAP
mmetsp:Transcript_96696/g.242573  ORF Transcript_96696/g.242573 Transcript_96696/m.242573 type:complete len:209 (+) Transcript_96696:2426-3052(+)